MPLRSYKPTSPGRRFMTRSTFEEITTDKPHKPLLESQEARQRPQQPGPPDRSPSRRRREAPLPASSTSSATSSTCRPAWRPSSTTRTARRASACSTTATARSATSSCPTGSRSATSSSPARAPRRGRQRPAAGATSRSARRSTTSSSCPAGAARSSAPPAPRPSCWPRRATTPRCACPRARSAGSSLRCMATVGQVGNLDHENQNLGKAGRARHMGQRPEVRGVVMNPRDHPHGGGEGKSPTGMPPKTPWGKPAMGHRTRRTSRPGRHRPLAAPQELGGRRADVTFPEEGPVRRGAPPRPGPGDEPAQREARCSRPGRAPASSSPTSSATPSPSTTARSTSRSTSPRTWSATASASSRPPAPTAGTASTPSARRR